MSEKILKVLSKLHFSAVALMVLVGLFFIIISTPAQIYDKYVIDRDRKCFYENASGWISVYDYENSKPKFDPDKFLAETSPNQSGFDKKTEDALKKCNVNLSNYGGNLNAYSKSVIVDNDPRPLAMFYVGLGFFAFAIFLVFAKKWTVWLFK